MRLNNDKGQIIVLDQEEKVVVVVTNDQVIEYDGYKVIVDHNADYRYVPEERQFKVIKSHPNKKTPLNAEHLGDVGDYTVGGYPTLINLPIQAGWDKTLVVATLTLEVHKAVLLKQDVKKLVQRSCEELLKKI